MKFMSFLASRLAKALFVVLGVVIINFFLIRLAPGDPATVLAVQSGTCAPAYVQQLRKDFALDKPLPVQIGLHLKSVHHPALGCSSRPQTKYDHHRSVKQGA